MDSSVLTFKEYNIAGNVLRAYYDADDKLVFVLDNTLDDRKPNALLVINPVGDRKWDDILANDYGVDLETVRPKKNNKYQKLDIEYSGLTEYDNLINAYKNGNDLMPALAALAAFREETVRRSAAERLAVAESNADKARETIIKTKESITELQLKLRQLRTKLSQQKKQVGREPTKKSASKILRTDAQIDAINEKLQRAKKRLNNAQRRLITADEDAELAREILERGPIESGVGTELTVLRPSSVMSVTPQASYVAADEEEDDEVIDEQASFTVDEKEPKITNAPLRADEDTAVVKTDEIYEENSLDETDDDDEETDNVTEKVEAETMADEDKKDEVKPLFDEDPGILDEEIAFKPIEFGVSSPAVSEPVSEKGDIYDNVIDDKPLSFTPPEQKKPVDDEEPVGLQTSPVLDTLKSVETPNGMDEEQQKLDSELTGGANNIADTDDKPLNVAPVTAPQQQESQISRPVPPVATLNNASGVVRPVSPITGTAAPTNPAPRKPTLIYYVMLVLLIGLSIFTLWLYQRSTTEKTPDLTATVSATEQIVKESIDESVESPLLPVLETPVVEQPVAPAPVEVPVPVAEPEPVVEPEPVMVEPEPAPVIEPVVTETIDDVVIQPIAEPEPVVISEPEPVVIETEEEILANKPSYNVSQNENMFVASPDYDTETMYNATTSVDLPTCPDGTAPDVNGCCTGEIYTNMGEMGFNCCPETGGDCFPPLI